MRSCPRCRVALKTATFSGRLREPGTGRPIEVQMDECPSCGGHWFDRHEAEATIGLREELRALDSVTLSQPRCHRCEKLFPSNMTLCPSCMGPLTLPCPSCQAPLAPIQALGLPLDLCGACLGVWFDADELKRLNQALMGRGASLGGEASYAVCASCGKKGMSRQDTYYGSEGMICGACVVADDWSGVHQAAAAEAAAPRHAHLGLHTRHRCDAIDLADLLTLFLD